MKHDLPIPDPLFNEAGSIREYMERNRIKHIMASCGRIYVEMMDGSVGVSGEVRDAVEVARASRKAA
ncbi:hypothetical protein [Croceicoccus sp. YJ47]|uniref:hypothetical protein n=1 Tax=Croceicoccus sp. YJ47 TaxID=2798724 RepID=UPI0019242CCF|nr:hypothetical protein [Croceicoccus sp. YJ47]QQN73917.1 hypothetical protein JD971_14400 [Croceicoccus sp. YJ47]